MSGIAGFVGAHSFGETANADLEKMAALLGPNPAQPGETGTVHQRALSAGLAWQRRDFEPACIAWNRSRNVGLLFIGEDFDLDQRTVPGTDAAGQRENEVSRLLGEYETAGLSFLSRLNGRFSGVIVDTRSGRTHLFNDRFGLNRIYVHECAAGCFFSTTARSILAVRPATRTVDARGLAEFFTVGCVLQNRSRWENVQLLPPGSIWTFSREGSVQKARYFDPRDWESQAPLTSDEYERQLVEVFSRIIPKYTRGAARLGMSLTGGLDSRMILAWSRIPAGSLECYTFGGPYRDCADVRIARRLAEVAGHPHRTLKIEPDFFRDFPQLAQQAVFASDGTMDVSGAVEIYANRRARQIAPIRLTGNYGSEILRANVAFRPGKIDRSLFAPEFLPLLDQAADTYRQEAVGHRLSFIAFKQVPWHHYSRFAAEYSELNPRSPFLDNELVALAYRAPAELNGSPQPILRLITEGNPALDSVPTDRALRARPASFPQKLRQRWQEFTVKAEYAYDYGMPPALTRVDRLLRPVHLERLFLGRHKFYHFRVWYRDQLAAALRSAITPSLRLSCYKEGVPQRLVEEHTHGRANRTLELHKLLTVTLTERLLAELSCHN